jgi:hypothetical protein
VEVDVRAVTDPPSCELDHPGRDVDGDDRRALLEEPLCVRASCASRIEDPFAGDRRKQGTDHRSIPVGVP